MKVSPSRVSLAPPLLLEVKALSIAAEEVDLGVPVAAITAGVDAAVVFVLDVTDRFED